MAMPLLSRKVDYALLVLSYLHRQSEGGCARRIAEHFGLSRAFVANILKELCQKQLLTSHRGVRGGYALRCRLENISLADLMDALDSPFELAECSRQGPGEACCFESICPVRAPIQEVHERIREFLGRLTLADLLRPGYQCCELQIGTDRTLPVRQLVGS
jgi:Rrf2 family protein